MNPPYDNGLHEKFLNKVLDITKKSISVQPGNFIFGNRKNKNFIKKIENCFCGVDKLTSNLSLFSAAIGNDLCIFNINTEESSRFLINGKESTLSNVSKFSDDNLIEKFNKIVSSLYEKDNIVNHLIKYDNEINDKYYVKIPRIRGHRYDGVSDDFYTLVSNNEEFIKTETIGRLDNVKQSSRSKLVYYIEFNTEKEAYNFINYLKTDFFRTCLYLLKVSQNVTSGRILRYSPWFDFSDSHFSKSPKEIDNWLFKKYGISDEIRKHIEEILPDYYNIR